MRFAEAHESLEEPLELPIRGKVYKIQPATAEDGIRLQEFLADMKDLHKKSKAGESVEDAAVKFHDSLDELEEVSLGKAVRDEMFADQAPAAPHRGCRDDRVLLAVHVGWGRNGACVLGVGGRTEAQSGPAANGDPDPTGRGHYDRKPASRTGTKPKAAASKSKG